MSTRMFRNSRDDEINELILRLQPLLPQLNQSHNSTMQVPPIKILEETCNYIKRLHKEVHDLSERLSQSLETLDTN